MGTALPDLTPDVTTALRRFHRTRWALTFAVAAIVGGAVLTHAVFVGLGQAKLSADTTALARDRVTLEAALARARASCGFYRDLAPLPITVGPTGKASKLGVQIVSDSRAAFVGESCPGTLPPPAPSFIRWARFYGIPIIETGTAP